MPATFTYKDLDAVIQNDVRTEFGESMKTAISRRQMSQTLVFPSDLGASYYDHYMTIKALKSGTTIAMFIPGGGGETTIQYIDKHDYAEIKLNYAAASAAGASFNSLTGMGNPAAFGAYLAAKGGNPINPGVEILYRSPELRKFQFTFLMAPTKPEESFTMEKIIRELRKNAAPDLAEAGDFTYQSPSEFMIEFFHKGSPNPHIPKIRKSVLTGIDVNYTPAGEWSTFKNGYPVSCMMTVEFLEMELLHKKLIEDGY